MTRTSISKHCVLIVICMLAHAHAYSKPITLFYGSKNSLEHLLTEHKGSKGIRKGSSCLHCHEDEEADLTKLSLKKSGETSIKTPGHLQAELEFFRVKSNLELVISFAAPKEAFNLSFMFDDNRSSAFQRAGCWSSCHSDMNEMPADKGQSKYLGKSRAKLSRTGGGDILKPLAELNALMSDGNFAELWEVQVGADSKTLVQQFTLLSKPEAVVPTNVSASALYIDGRWQLKISRATKVAGLKSTDEPSQTFGIALHQGNKGYRHWVTLPNKFGTDDSADYKVEVR